MAKSNQKWILFTQMTSGEVST